MRLLAWLLVKVTYCKNCGHPRTYHTRKGCTACKCVVVYMDIWMFE